MKRLIVGFILPLIGISLFSIGRAEARQFDDSHHRGVLHAAYRFEKAAKHMHRQLRHALGRDELTWSARGLARAAKQFRHALEHGEPYRYQRRQFRRLTARFQDFRHQYRHAYLPEWRPADRAIRRLRRAFRDLRYETHHARDHRRSYRRSGRELGDYRPWLNSDVALVEDSP